MKKGTVLLLFAFFFTTSERAFSQADTIKVNSKTEQLIQSNNRFGLELFKEVANQTDSSQNFMISPLSATLALAMTYNGAEDNTKTAFENTFHFDGLSTNEINKSLSGLCKALEEADPQVTLNLANSIWYRDSYNVERHFININKKYYDADVVALNFNSPSSVKMINNWANGKTHGKIPSVINQIDPLDIIILINATYFNGTWVNEFSPLNTKKEPFTLQNGKIIQIPTMMQETLLGYLSNDLFTAVELPYGNRNFSMVLMLPNKGKTVKNIENAINQRTWKQWTIGLHKEEVMRIHLPKFKFEFEKTLNDALSKLGLGNAFSDSANFANISPDTPLSISVVKQKTYIDVNEEGTEAAAVTSVIMKATAEIHQSIFFNHPFLFAITEKSTNTILFIGCVMNPSRN